MSPLSNVLLVSVITLVCLLAPVAFAHYGRSPSDRLGKRTSFALLLLILATFVVFLEVSSHAVPVSGGLWLPALGITIGTFGLIAYGVLERLVVVRIPDRETYPRRSG